MMNMGKITTDPPLPQESMNHRYYNQTRRNRTTCKLRRRSDKKQFKGIFNNMIFTIQALRLTN
jgi:hypothetical protein